MSSLLKSLVQRNLVDGVGIVHHVSLESAAVETGSDVVESLDELHAIAGEISTHGEEATQAANLSDGLDTLIDNTIDAYKDSEIDERGAELLEVSIECLIRASGLPLHVRAVVPSFESVERSKYSTEAEVKKAGVVSRLMGFLRDSWLRLVAVAKRFLGGLRKTTGGLESYVAAVQARAARMVDGTGGKVKVNGKIIQALNGKRPAAAITAGLTEYTKFSMQVNMNLGGVTSVKPLPNRPDQATAGKWLTDQQHGLGDAIHNGLPRLQSVEFLPGHKFLVTHGTGTLPLVGAEAKVEVAPIPAAGEVDSLSSAEVKATLTAAVEAIKHLKEMEESVDKWIDASNRAIPHLSVGINGLSKQPQEGEIPNVVATMKSLMAANTIYAKAYGLTLPHVITMIHNNVAFADQSIAKVKRGATATEQPASPATAN